MTTWNDTQHPELQPDEAFVRNDGDEGFQRVREQFKTARQGKCAYNIHGMLIEREGFRPIFRKKSELQRDDTDTAPPVAEVQARKAEPVD